MSFAFKEELNDLVIFRRCCSAANLLVQYWHCHVCQLLRGLIYCMSPMAQNWGLGPYEVGATGYQTVKMWRYTVKLPCFWRCKFCVVVGYIKR